MGSYPAKIVSLWHTVFDGAPRDPNGAIGVVGIGRLGGDFTQSKLLDVQDKVYALIGMLAGVNLLLFFFNLLPLLPLDGGHVAGALVEAAKRGRARLRARAHAAAHPGGDVPESAPAPIYRRHRADAAGDVCGGFGTDRVDPAHPVGRHRQPDQPRRRIMADVTTSVRSVRACSPRGGWMTVPLGMPLGAPPAPPPVLAPRRPSRQIKVGSVAVGGDAPISVQSMTTTLTADVDTTLQQIAELTAAGCDIVRVAVPTQDDADALAEIARHSRRSR